MKNMKYITCIITHVYVDLRVYEYEDLQIKISLETNYNCFFSGM